MAKEMPKYRAMGMIEMSEDVEIVENIIDLKAKNFKVEDDPDKPKMSQEELKAFHSEKGGVVLDDKEFSRYKFYLELLAAEQMFDASFPALAHTTEEFAEIYKEREILVKELERYR